MKTILRSAVKTISLHPGDTRVVLRLCLQSATQHSEELKHTPSQIEQNLQKLAWLWYWHLLCFQYQGIKLWISSLLGRTEHCAHRSYTVSCWYHLGQCICWTNHCVLRCSMFGNMLTVLSFISFYVSWKSKSEAFPTIVCPTQYSKYLEYPDFRISRFPHFRISGLPEIRICGSGYVRIE